MRQHQTCLPDSVPNPPQITGGDRSRGVWIRFAMQFVVDQDSPLQGMDPDRQFVIGMCG